MAAPLLKSNSHLSGLGSPKLSRQRVFPDEEQDQSPTEIAALPMSYAPDELLDSVAPLPYRAPDQSQDPDLIHDSNLQQQQRPSQSTATVADTPQPFTFRSILRSISGNNVHAAAAAPTSVSSNEVRDNAFLNESAGGRSIATNRTSSSGDMAKDPSTVIAMTSTSTVNTASVGTRAIPTKETALDASYESGSLSAFKSRSDSNLYQRLSFGHMNSIIKAGSKRNIIPDEYPSIEPADKSDSLSNLILSEWKSEQERHGGNAKLSRALWNIFGIEYFTTGVIYLFESIIKISQSYLLGRLLGWFESDGDAMWGYIWAGALSAAVCIHALINQYKFFLSTRIGMQIRVSIVAAIYKKCLKLPLSRISSPGQVLNMITNDVQRFEDASGFAYYILLGPLETMLVFYFLYEKLGLSALAAVGILLFALVPMQSGFAKRFAELRRTTNTFRDDRTKSLSDMILGIIVVKLYAWETPFMERIKSLRNKELGTIRSSSALRAVNEALFFASSALVSGFTFTTFYLSGGVLNASIVFTTLTYLQTVRMSMTNLFSKGLQFTSEAMVSLQRIEAFLKLPEIESDNGRLVGNVADVTMLKEMNDPSIMVAIRNASFSWRPVAASATATTKNPEPANVLHDITLRIRSGELVGVCGPVGAGKTSLINAVLGELECTAGHYTVRSTRLAYVSQSQWILPGTIRDNILFGQPYRHEWFIRVVQACALDRDLAGFPLHEFTFLGERGFTLSGGQRARLALARAVYADADVYLLDDPLSALDAQVGKHIFDHCISGLLKKKAVLLVTHLLKYIEKCDQVFLIEHGSISQSGTFGGVASMTGSTFALSMREFSMAEGLDCVASGNTSKENGATAAVTKKHEKDASKMATVDAPADKSGLYGLVGTPANSDIADRDFSQVISSKTILPSKLGKQGIRVNASAPIASHGMDVNAPKSRDQPDTLHAVKTSTSESEDQSMYQSGNSHSTTESNAAVTREMASKAKFNLTDTARHNQTDAHLAQNGQQGDNNIEDIGEDDDDDISDAEIEALRISLAKRQSIAKSQHGVEVEQAPNTDASKAAKAYNTEEVMNGSVDSDIYYRYLHSGASSATMVGLFFAIVIGQILMLATDWWLSKWSSMSEMNQKMPLNMYLFIALAVTTIFVSILRAQWFFSICMRASEHMFNGMLTSLFGVPIGFFQTNPHGRIMNRLSKDMALVDEILPQTFFDFIQRTSMIFGTVAVAAWVIPYVLLTFPAVVFVFMYLRQSYMRAARQMKRLEATTRSPVLSSLSSTLEGLALLRSFGAQERFAKDFVGLQDNNTRVYFLFMCSGRWLGLRLDVLAAVFFAMVATASVAVHDALGLSAASVGLLLSYVLQLVGLLQWSVRQSSEVENLMVSTERILEYSALDSEPGIDTPVGGNESPLSPAQRWPSRGHIEIQNMWLKYPNALTSVLKNVSVTIQAGTKVGIVGRSGAGKSSFLQALFRLVEPSPPGSIVIDGIKTSDLGLRDLRSRISIIPQDPFCFKGTLRFNLDPFGRHTDDELWRVLEAVELKSTVSAMPARLESEVAENGGNWSVGERQLICLARAILRGSKLVVMDEATASIDVHTDQLLHKLVGADPESVTQGRPSRQSAFMSASNASPFSVAYAAQQEMMGNDYANMSARSSRIATTTGRSHSSSLSGSVATGPGFTSSTVITIAHRLHTIIDYDHVLVFDNGELVEQGDPSALLEKDPVSDQGAFFARMVAGYGPETQQLLMRLAATHKRIVAATVRKERRMTAASASSRRGTLDSRAIVGSPTDNNRMITGTLDRRRRDTNAG